MNMDMNMNMDMKMKMGVRILVSAESIMKRSNTWYELAYRHNYKFMILYFIWTLNEKCNENTTVQVYQCFSFLLKAKVEWKSTDKELGEIFSFSALLADW